MTVSIKFALFIALLYVYIHHYAEANLSENGDFYELLGITRDSSDKEIRKAFKKLAVKMHPDKNKDDKEAEDKFIRLMKAYETLKDPDLRKRYDLYGEERESTNKYQSYNYYANEFGLYDDDPTIITLTRGDFDLHISSSNEYWFVNFYSPQCHHCHTLAPTWRKLSRELQGVIRIAAVNCGDEWGLCTQQQIFSYPTLNFYEKETRASDAQQYYGEKTLHDLQQFVLSKLDVKLKNINLEDWENGLDLESWLLFLCPDGSSCLEYDTQIKIAAAIEGLVKVGIISDKDLIKKIYKDFTESPTVVFWQVNDEAQAKESEERAKVHLIKGSDTKEIVDTFLGLLPVPELINDDMFRDIRSKLSVKGGGGGDEENPWLLCFFLGQATDLDIQLRKLPALLPNMKIGLIHCGKSAQLCASLHISHYPSWGVIKEGGAFELHHGRDSVHDIVAFAKDSSKSINLHALSPADFNKIRNEGELWFIDWFAPWCPPCRKLMPEIRKTSQRFETDKIQFGTIDCTLHKDLCMKNQIPGYPTVALYNGSTVHYYHGIHNEESMVDFIENLLNPLVIHLDDNNFAQLKKKPKEELWVVDYYASWCGACKLLSPKWRTLANAVKDIKEIKIAQVDCEESSELCNSQNIRAYPTIRLYPLGSKGLNSVALYHGNFEVTNMKRWIIDFLPSSVELLTPASFKKQILTKNFLLPWLIDFYAPWCGFCTNFEPEFMTVSRKLEGKVRSGKVDCEAHRQFCAEMRITGYPTVKLFFSPTENVQIQSYQEKDIVKIVKGLIKDRKSQHDEL